jgi:hypothetical protein
MAAVKRHYDGAKRTIHVETPINLANLAEPLVIVPLDRHTYSARTVVLPATTVIFFTHRRMNAGCESTKSARNHSLPADSKELREEKVILKNIVFSAPCETVSFCKKRPPLQLIEARQFGVRATQ